MFRSKSILFWVNLAPADKSKNVMPAKAGIQNADNQKAWIPVPKGSGTFACLPASSAGLPQARPE
jgi:hypothetical protein